MENDTSTECHTWVQEYVRSSNVTLAEVNDILILRLIGGIIFLLFLIVVGLAGNIHVIYIYSRKFKTSNYRIYVLWLAMLDIVNCTVSAPLVIVYLFNPVTFPDEIFCKVFRFILYFCSICSTSALVIIAIDRFRKIQKPLSKQISANQARSMCVLCIVVAVVLSWPALLLYTLTPVQTGVDYLQGTRCLAAPASLKYLAIFHFCHVIFFMAVSSALVGVYVLIGRQIYRHSSFVDSVRRGSDQFDPKTKHKGNSCAMARAAISNSSFVRTTGTLFAVTLAYIFSALPHHCLSIVFFVVPDFDCNLSLISGQFFYTFVWSYFVNSAINPFIYGFRDKKFRKEVRDLYHSKGK